MKILSLLFSILLLNSQPSHARTINIGMVFDGPMKRKFLPIDQVKKEIIAITEGEFDIQFPSNKVVDGQWQLDAIREAILKLNQDDSVDLILTNGLLSSHQAAQIKTLKKPLIATIVADRILQKLPYIDGVSGKTNFTYITDSHTIEQDLRQYYQLSAFKHLLIPVDHNILQVLPSLTEMITQVQKQLGFKLTFVPVHDDLAKILSEFPQTADAVYITPLMRFSRQELMAFATEINRRGLPSFSLLGRPDLALGFMATLRGRKVDALRFSRRIALNVQSILLGTDAAELKVDLDQPAKLAINMAVVKTIGLPVKWRLLEQAELLKDEPFARDNPITLNDAINRSVAANLGLQADMLNISLANDQVEDARSALLPQLKINISGQQIDKDRASSFQTERSADAELKFSQLIYSERKWASFDVAKLLKQSEDAAFQTRVLDVMQNSASAYLRVLLTKAAEQVRQADLQVSEANLELAQARLKIGYSDQSDVLRWQSEIANNQSNLYLARSERERSETALKQQLHLPLKEDLAVTDEGISHQIEMLNDEKFKRFFDNSLSFDTFIAFEVDRAFANAPELKFVDNLIESGKRQLVAGKRAYYIPDVSINAALGQNISQGGVGANNPNFQQDNWSVGFLATLPLYTSGARSAEVSRARHAIKQNTYQRENMYEQIETRVRSALQKAKGSFPAIRLSKAAAQTARQNFNMVSDAYAKGVVSITRLIDAQNAVLSTNLAAAQTMYLFMIDWVEVQRAVANFDLLLDQRGMDKWYQEMEIYFENNS